jgi:predicted dehydrogenase
MKTIRIGIFGLRRGASFIDHILANNGEIVAICDKDQDRIQKALDKLEGAPVVYSDFDAFLEHPMDAVFLANYFHEHAPYAIRCLEKNIHVLSECTSNGTLAEGVALVRAAEKSTAIYMLAENYPYMLFNQEMKRVYDGGTLGNCLYAEGEYNHAGNCYNADNIANLYDSLQHWRNYLPRTYYLTHSLAPLVHATGAMPVRVTAMPVFGPVPTDCVRVTHVAERAAIITCLNDDRSVFKMTGCASFGASDNSYRLCCRKGQIENVRGTGGKLMLRYNPWDTPEGVESIQNYDPPLDDPHADLIRKAGHGGGDFFVIREFFSAIREGRQAAFDVYFATRLASTAIMAHRSMLELGVPYDVPDFRKEEDRIAYENDTLTPFWSSDGTAAPTLPCTTEPDYGPSETQIQNFLQALKKD